MILSFLKFFRGYVYVHLTGYAPERFLNLCGNHNILIWHLTPKEDGYYFYISIAGFKQLRGITRKTRTRVRIVKRVGLPFFFYHYRKRKMFGCGLLLCLFLLYFMSGFIWNIEIEGNSYLSNEVILDFLKEEHSSFGTRISSIDCEKLEETLRNTHHEVIWTSIQIYGTKMTVSVQESLLPEENYQKKEQTTYDIVAAADGTITSIITRSGTPCVAVGSQVKKGDVLVSGRLEILDDNGELAQYLYHSADSDITAQVEIPYKAAFSEKYMLEEETGNQKTDYAIGFSSFFFHNPFFKSGYSQAHVTTEVWQLHISKNFYLPIYLEKMTYREYERLEKNYTQSQAKAYAMEQFENYMKKLEQKGIHILTKNVMIEKENQDYIVSGDLKVSMSIVSYQPTEILEINSEERQLTDESD